MRDIQVKLIGTLVISMAYIFACGSTKESEENEGGTEAEVTMNSDDLCASYCDNMSEAGCFDLGSSIGFETVESCLTACVLYNTMGEEGALTGNTAQCRAKHASLATMFKDVNNGDIHCTHAGIDGGNVCVDSRPTTEEQLATNYCAKINMFCPEQAATAFNDCGTEVTILLNEGTFRTDGGAADTIGSTIQCLTNTAVLSGLVDQNLCPSALPESSTCVD